MGVSSFYGLQTALRGLTAQQRSLEVTGHNIANAATVGYSRQEAVLGASSSAHLEAAKLNGSGAQLGSGVEVVEYRRMRSQFLDVQHRAQSTQLGAATARAETAAGIEAATGEESDGDISSALSAFWNAWSAFGNDPTGAGARQALVSAGQTLTQRLGSVSGQLDELSTQLGSEYTLRMSAGGEVDQIATELASLNGTISSLVERGEQPNDLQDRRDLLLDRLAQLGQVSTQLESDGTMTVGFGDAAATEPLVQGGAKTWPLTTLTDPGGRLGALRAATAAGGTIATAKAGLDAVAASLASTVNAVHGTPPFFSGSTAATIAVAATPTTVVAGTGTAAGANDVAKAVAALRGGAAEQSYAGWLTGVASAAASTERAQATSEALLSSLEARRQSESGVSLDEEMANLIRFQRGYQASSRAMNAVDTLLDTLINRTGRVGL